MSLVPEPIRHKSALLPLSLKENFGWTFAGNVVYAGSQGVVLIILAKIGSQEMVGQFALALAICTPVFMFTGLKLRDIQATDVTNRYSFSHYLGLRLLSTIIAVFIVIGIVFAAGYPEQTALTVIVMTAAKSFESFSDLIYGFFQQQERMDHISKSLIIRGVLSLPALGITVYLSNNIVWGVAAMAVIWLLILISYDVSKGSVLLKARSHVSQGSVPSVTTIWTKGLWSTSELKTLGGLAWFALPLGLATTLTSLTTNMPRYIIEHTYGTSLLGIYAALAYPVIAGNMLVSAMAQASLHRLARHFSTGNMSAYRVLLLKLLGSGLLMGIVAVGIASVGSSQILTVLFNSEYAEYADVFVWMTIAAGLNYLGWFLYSGLTAAGRLQVQFTLQIVVVLTVTVAAVILIPLYGLLGAAWATCIGFVIRMILLVFVYLRY